MPTTLDVVEVAKFIEKARELAEAGDVEAAGAAIVLVRGLPGSWIRALPVSDLVQARDSLTPILTRLVAGRNPDDLVFSDVDLRDAVAMVCQVAGVRVVSPTGLLRSAKAASEVPGLGQRIYDYLMGLAPPKPPCKPPN